MFVKRHAATITTGVISALLVAALLMGGRWLASGGAARVLFPSGIWMPFAMEDPAHKSCPSGWQLADGRELPAHHGRRSVWCVKQ